MMPPNLTPPSAPNAWQQFFLRALQLADEVDRRAAEQQSNNRTDDKNRA